MKSNIQHGLTLFLHENSGDKCLECIEALRLFKSMKGYFKKKDITFSTVEDNSLEGIFQRNNYKFPLLKIESMPPDHYSGLDKIQDFKSKYLNN